MDSSRVLVAVILSIVLIVAYQELVLKRLYPPLTEQQQAEQAKQAKAAQAQALTNAPAGAASGTAAVPGAVSSPAVNAVGGAPPSGAQSTALTPANPGGPERTIEVDSDFYTAVFTSRGGRLRSFLLKHYRQTAAKDSAPYDMIRVSPDGHLPLGAVMTREGNVLDDSQLAYATSAPERIELAPGPDSTVEFTAKTADGATITKTFTFKRSSYVFAMDVAVTGGPKLQELGVSMSQPLTAHEGYRDIPELQADVDDKVITETQKKLEKGDVKPVSGTITYAGFGDLYFLSAFLPETPTSGQLTMAYAGDEAIARVLFDNATHIHSQIYMGPKLLEALEAVNPSLRKSIDFGIASILALVFLRTLKLFHYIAPNYGWDIILLTVSIRILFLPMSIKSQRSMMKMQRLQPQMERLREKYKDDNTQLQKEMVDLYKRNHVNPLGGCAPMALQFPIFIGLYEALLNSVELRHAPFMGWINDLSTPDCLHVPGLPQIPYLHCHGLPVLVLLMGASQFLQQYMTPTSPDPNQQRMMMLTPLIFTVMLLNFPAGLALYYFSSNILGVVQQYFLNKEFQQYTPAT